MSHFNAAVSNLLALEGGSSNHSADKGGTTNYGISLRFLKMLPRADGDITGDGHVDRNDIEHLKPSNAVHFYRKFFWAAYKIDRIKSEEVAIKSLDIFVNMRGATAALVHQRAANDLGADIEVDGILGSKSFKAINELDENQYLTCLRYQAWRVYQSIMKEDPTQEVFRRGWQSRAFS